MSEACAAMKLIGTINGAPVYWADPVRFEKPGVWYWDGKTATNVHVPIPVVAQEPDDVDELTRRADVMLNGDGAAKQASLCDIVGQLEHYAAGLEPRGGLIGDHKTLVEERSELQDALEERVHAAPVTADELTAMSHCLVNIIGDIRRGMPASAISRLEGINASLFEMARRATPLRVSQRPDDGAFVVEGSPNVEEAISRLGVSIPTEYVRMDAPPRGSRPDEIAWRARVNAERGVVRSAIANGRDLRNDNLDTVAALADVVADLARQVERLYHRNA